MGSCNHLSHPLSAIAISVDNASCALTPVDGMSLAPLRLPSVRTLEYVVHPCTLKSNACTQGPGWNVEGKWK